MAQRSFTSAHAEEKMGTRCEVRYIGNLISFFKIETRPSSRLTVNCVTAAGKATNSIKVAIDVFGIANVLKTMTKKEIRQENVYLEVAKRHLESWRTQCFSMGLFEQIEVDLDDRGEVDVRNQG